MKSSLWLELFFVIVVLRKKSIMPGEKDPFSNYLEGKDSPIGDEEVSYIENVPVHSVELSPENHAQNLNYAVLRFLTLFDGVTNPYTGETYDFSHIDDISQLKHSIQYCGLVWTESDYKKLMNEVREKTLPFDMYTKLVKAYLDTTDMIMPEETKLRELYEISQDPSEAIMNLIKGFHLFDLTPQFIENIETTIKNFEKRQVRPESPDKYRDKWIELYRYLGTGEVTLKDYAEAILHIFPEVAEKNPDTLELDSYLQDIEESYFRRNIEKHIPNVDSDMISENLRYHNWLVRAIGSYQDEKA